MPHLRIEVAEEWLREDFIAATGFDAKKLLDHLVQVVAGLKMDHPDNPGEKVPFINLSNLKHAIIPVHHAHVAGDPSKRFLHVTMSAGNETRGRTAEVRRRVALTLGNEVDKFVTGMNDVMKDLASVTVHVLDIDRERGYTTTAERKKLRAEQTSKG